MNDGLIPRRYAKALYKAAVDRKADTEVYAMASKLTKAFAAEPKLDAAMANPFVAAQDKLKLILTAAEAPKKGAAADLLAKFVELLEQNRRIGMAYAMFLAYEQIYRQAHGIKRVTVTSAAPLDKATADRIAKAVQKQLAPGETTETQWVTDPQLIGGFTVNIDNKKLDASAATRLEQMRQKILSN